MASSTSIVVQASGTTVTKPTSAKAAPSGRGLRAG